MASPILYLIRHGEKDKDPTTGKDGEGLNAAGLSRAQQLVQVFSSQSPYNIGAIIAQQRKESKKHPGEFTEDRPFDTVQPLSASMPNVPFTSDIARDDTADTAEFIHRFVKHWQEGQGNLLLCWEHHQLLPIVQAIIQKQNGDDADTSGLQPYPDSRFDVIWTMNAPYDKIDSWTSEHCTPQDDAYKAEGGWNYTTDGGSLPNQQ